MKQRRSMTAEVSNMLNLEDGGDDTKNATSPDMVIVENRVEENVHGVNDSAIRDGELLDEGDDAKNSTNSDMVTFENCVVDNVKGLNDSATSDGELSDEDSQYSYEADDGGGPLPMPPLKYARIMGSLPRDDESKSTALSVKVTASAMGRVVGRPSHLLDKKNESSMQSGSNHGYGARQGENSVEWNEYDDDDEIDRSLTRVYHVLALGFQDGKVRLVDALTGGSVLFGSTPGDGGAWYVNPSAVKRGYDEGQRIVGLSFDSGASYLSALNASGDAAIFGPLKWGKQSQRITVSEGEGQNRLGFLASFVGTESEKTNESKRKITMRPPFALMKPPTSTARFTYEDPQSFRPSLLAGGSSGSAHSYHPTCMALDPAYSRRKERALIVGFDDGRLVLSKLQGAAGVTGITSYFVGGGTSAAGGGTTVKKVDSVLYQGMIATSLSGDQAGIEAVTWRGGLVAWADSSGVRLFDIESMSRIAHIDRPTGARRNLYPTISELRPVLVFERSDSLLIAWGDCLIGLLINDSHISTAATNDGTPAKVITKKTVQATMAWEMDCVACGVAPMDEKHVAVLGLVPTPPSSIDSSDSDDHVKSKTLSNDYSVAGGDNMLELQVVNREDGKSISSDRLPLSDINLISQAPQQTIGNNQIVTGNATEFCLLSSFACPRMDGSAEWDVLNDVEKGDIARDLGDVCLESKPPDLHLRWNLCNDVCSTGKEIQSEAAIYDDDRSVASNVSICSDNYVFALSEPIDDILPGTSDLPTTSPPPVMAVIYSYDACLVLTRDVDDVISYTRSLGKPALALRQALALRREVRRHEIDELIDEFFIALLRFDSRGKDRPLSFSRLKIAAESLPILLGGDAIMWQRWILMFSRIPGGLFVIREKIPVRDPQLPEFLFNMCLEKMLEDAILSRKGQRNVINEDENHRGEEEIVSRKMFVLFLETMRCWGSTSNLRKRVRLHRHCAQNQRGGLQWHFSSGTSSVDPFIQQAEKDLQRRISQTAFGILENTHFPTSSLQNNSSMHQYIDSSRDSLFDVNHFLTRLGTRLRLGYTDNIGCYANDDTSSNVLIGSMGDNPAIILEVMAELELMRERYDRALGYYLAFGSRFMNESMTPLEETAVLSVNSFVMDSMNSSPRENSHLSILSHEGDDDVERNKYGFILSLIELHQLSHVLLKKNYFFAENIDNSSAESPVVALIALAGLSQAGTFFVNNCSPPESSSADPDENAPPSGSNLPLDLIVEQLKPRPKLLYWFLFQVFVNKADMYISFPTTTVPPVAITNLHKIQFSLFVDFFKESEADPPTSMNDRDTPFIAFLRAALPHGGIQADYVRRCLEEYRGGNVNNPVFARELAFVIENFSDGSVADAKEILQIYLRGSKNLFMAVAYAERNTMYSSILFDMLVEHCITPDPTSNVNQNSAMGALFGNLLEAAAHNGSDLASLVSRIPKGMLIEGLRPKLIAAISDYRYKVKLHELVDGILVEDKVSILRELNHVSRRGERLSLDKRNQDAYVTRTALPAKSIDVLKSQRRNVYHSKVFSLPVR